MTIVYKGFEIDNRYLCSQLDLANAVTTKSRTNNRTIVNQHKDVSVHFNSKPSKQKGTTALTPLKKKVPIVPSTYRSWFLQS